MAFESFMSYSSAIVGHADAIHQRYTRNLRLLSEYNISDLDNIIIDDLSLQAGLVHALVVLLRRSLRTRHTIKLLTTIRSVLDTKTSMAVAVEAQLPEAVFRLLQRSDLDGPCADIAFGIANTMLHYVSKDTAHGSHLTRSLLAYMSPTVNKFACALNLFCSVGACRYILRYSARAQFFVDIVQNEIVTATPLKRLAADILTQLLYNDRRTYQYLNKQLYEIVFASNDHVGLIAGFFGEFPLNSHLEGQYKSKQIPTRLQRYESMVKMGKIIQNDVLNWIEKLLITDSRYVHEMFVHIVATVCRMYVLPIHTASAVYRALLKACNIVGPSSRIMLLEAVPTLLINVNYDKGIDNFFCKAYLQNVYTALLIQDSSVLYHLNGRKISWFAASLQPPGTECCICLNNLTEHNTVKTDCNHMFHGTCLLKWHEVNTDCPVCRDAGKSTTEALRLV